ncbi:MAG: Ig-like domain-containing protein [Candidatus Dormiibacterota bacterium]
MLATPLLLTGCFNAPPQIVALAPADGSTQQDANAAVEVVFDQPVDRQSVAAHFSVCALKHGGCLPGLPGCTNLPSAFTASSRAACWVSWLNDQSEFVFHHPRALFAPNTKYQFSLGAGVSSTAGTVNSLDHLWDLTSAAAPVLTSSTPGNGASQVTRDADLGLSFSRAMSPSSLDAAVVLSPSTGLRVLADSLDPSSFEVVPSQPLDPDTAYTLTVDRRATDAHGQPLLAPVTVHFHTGGTFSPAGHALILAGPAGGPATEAVLTQLSPPSRGQPIPGEVLMQVPLCNVSGGCGAVLQGHPTAEIDQGAIAPGAGWLALVETDLTVPGSAPFTRIIDLATGLDQLTLGGTQEPSWSPDGATLSLVTTTGAVELYQPAPGALSALQPTAPASGAAVWTGAGDTLAIPVGASGDVPAHLDLANPSVGARYALPGLSGAVTKVVAAPSGEELAVQVVSAGATPETWITDPSSGKLPTELGGELIPIGFTDGATLLAAAATSSGGPELVQVSLTSGATTQLAAAPGRPDLADASLAPGGRQIAYLDTTVSGTIEAVIANADGTGATPVPLTAGGLVPLSIVFGG